MHDKLAGNLPAALLPHDQHNRMLQSHVRPPEWKNPQPRDRYHLVVVGAGTAGLVTAAGAAALGAKVALVERELMGGDCLNVGCVPSKALISAARAAAMVRRAGQYGIEVPEGVRVDFGAVMQRMRRLRARISPHDSAARFREMGVDVFLGHGRFTGPDRVDVDGQTLRFKKAVIATGARAAVPPVPGLDEVSYLTNETVFSLTELPSRLAVLGAGPIGVELAQAMARLGSRVWLIEAAHGILPREDEDASSIVKQAIQRDGVQVLCCGRETTVSGCGQQVRVRLESHEQRYEVVVDQLLVAAGRAPNVEGLGLEEAGVAFDHRSGVHVNDRLQTTNRRIYAAGDVCSVYKFTHAADFMARIVIQNALFLGRAKASRLTIPWCTYSWPEIAHVGLSQRDADQRGVAIDSFVQPLSEVDRAVLDGEEEGFVKVHVKKGTDRIVGATIVAPHAGEMISEIALVMTSGLGLRKIAATIHPYPTVADAIRRLGDQYNRTRLTPAVRWLLRRWLAWTG